MDQRCVISPNAAAMVIEEMEMMPKFQEEYISRAMNTAELKAICGFEVSKEALDEYLSRFRNPTPGENVNHIPEKYKQLGADIILFSPISRLVHRPLFMDEAMAHEVWHIVERECNVLGIACLITEGTATYAAQQTLCRNNFTPPEACFDFNTMLYRGAAGVVHEHVKHWQNPLAYLLDKKIRTDMEVELVHRCEPRIPDMMRRMVMNPEEQARLKYEYCRCPAYQRLQGDVTKRTILQMYTDIGAYKLAAEIADQDLSQAIAWFKMVGF